MLTVLRALPRRVALAFLMTDMQGHDVVALRSAGSELLRAEFVVAEVNYGGFSAYPGVSNSFCDLLLHMDNIGMELVGVRWSDRPPSHLRKNATAAQRHCGPDGRERHDWPKFADGTLEIDSYWASPRRTRARPPVREREWPWSRE